jgi:glutamine synthetase
MSAAESALVLKGALKELARQSNMYAVFMSRSPGSTVPSMQEISLSINGLIKSPDLGRIHGFLNEARSILQPSINAFKVGPIPSLRITDTSGSVQIHDFKASSEADPFTSIAVILAALDFEINSIPAKNARNLADATDQLAGSQWAQEWLGREYIENTLPLVRNEIALFEESITDWETTRYWSAS